MHVACFPCPHCSTVLRVRDRSFVGQTITCPECREHVQIQATGGNSIAGVAADTMPAGSRSASPPRLSPASVGWIIAGAAGLMLLGFLTFPQSRSALLPTSQTSLEKAAPPPTDSTVEMPAHGDLRALEQPLAKLHQQLTSSVNESGHFPRGTLTAEGLGPEQRLSWIAVLVAAADAHGPQPRWNLAWNDTTNDRFVRRQQPLLLNPKIENVVSSDRYPATHFVGVAGIGPGAASLAADDPRAGIFGHERTMRPENVHDGLANTMLVAGVEKRLGSWAAGGDATVRGFTAEPYIGGPDGFGTGDADGMQVLMADGSVRFVSRQTSPAVIRRLACMNDESAAQFADPPTAEQMRQGPLAAAEPDAGKSQEVATVRSEETPSLPAEAKDSAAAQIIADVAGRTDVPIDVVLAEPAPTYNVEQALRQPITRFDQRDEVPARQFLRLLEEMAAVPIHTEELTAESSARLDRPLTLLLEETTLAEILTAALNQISLEFEGRPAGIFLRDAAPPE